MKSRSLAWTRPTLVLVATALFVGCGSQDAPPDPADPDPQTTGLVLTSGSGQFTFADPRGNTSRPIAVRYFMPTDFGPETPIVFVMHGASRDGIRYFNDWEPEARTRGFLLLVPEFGAAEYPGSAWYNLGNVYESEEPGTARPQDQWTYSAIGHLFDTVRAVTGSQETTFRLY